MEAELAALPTEEVRCRAMGTTVHLIAVDAPPGALDRAKDRIQQLEARWSRFISSSELSQLNRAGGRHMFVSAETFVLIELAIDAWTATRGRFDPTILSALVANGYDRSFEHITDTTASHARHRSVITDRAPGCRDIELDPVLRTVSMPVGVALDLGGIAKGHTADVIASELIAAGAIGACVNVGGDVAVVGTPPRGDSWSIAIDDVVERGVDLGVVQLSRGGVATSTPRLRAWTQDGRPRHHLIDPATAEPADTGIASVTVVAATAAWAEALTKAAYIAGYPAALDVLDDGRAHGILLLDTGEVALTNGFAGALHAVGPAS